MATERIEIMNNKFRINKARVELAQSGIIAENENIYTKNAWRRMGYKVRKEETPITIIPIYVYAPHKVYDENGKFVGTSNMLYVWANFYKQSQVTEIRKGGR